MDYQKHYDSLINKARLRTLEEYVEEHHIIPRCLGGTNDKSNLVALTYREHFIAHWLLCKLHPNNSKLKLAFRNMVYTGKNKRIVSGWMFETVKRHIRDNFIPWNKGKRVGARSEEAKLKTSETLKAHWAKHGHNRKGVEPWNKGKQNSQIAWNKGKEMPKFKCVHCGKEASQMNITKWHNDNCRTANK